MTARKAAIIALFIALSTVGAAIKIPAVVGSVALDTFPALLASALLGVPAGSIIAALGHIVSAIIGGMPLGQLHIIIAVEMAIIVGIFGFLYLKGRKKTAVAVFFVGNALIAPLPFIMFLGTPFYIAVVPSLIAGAFINVMAAFLAIPRIGPILKKRTAAGR
ncbi:ECF transporter S component [Peribacillus saganii]|uniref:ECF transporter S component n=1 Tax=Peribacillus saganii TaxID=2303992 RepID=A0A372LV17_9BACI|nr:ECF transporter S component [Peribacillus saganii]RFU71414.1 ECF transporter S component [Peribacillus saganii]